MAPKIDVALLHCTVRTVLHLYCIEIVRESVSQDLLQYTVRTVGADYVQYGDYNSNMQIKY